MMKRKLCFPVFFLVCLTICTHVHAVRGNAWRENVPGRHRGAITFLLRDSEERILSAGEDGFLGIWDSEKALDRFQLSLSKIDFMALRPLKTQIAIIEDDENNGSRVSAWDYEAKENIFTISFADKISYINYSARGSFIIAAPSRRPGLILIDSETGQLLEPPQGISGSVTFAATGSSERVMITYLSSGVLSYWELASGEEMQRFSVPPNIAGGVLFGNYRFFAGFDSRGLLILDAVTGAVLARAGNINNGRIFIDNPGSAQFSCLSYSAGRYILNHMEVTMSGNLVPIDSRNISLSDISSVASIDRQNIVLGTAQGALWLLNRYGERALRSETPEKIIDAAASRSVIAFISENDGMGFIPLDFALLEDGSNLMLESTQGPLGSYTNITADKEESRFLLWHSGRTIPMIKTLLGRPGAFFSSRSFLNNPELRFPFRSAAILGDNILILNTTGTVSAMDRQTGDLRFSQSVAGSLDAAFIDRDTLIISRSVVGMSTPFLVIDVSTGETVHINYPAIAGTRLSSDGSGVIYASVISQSARTTNTSIVRLNAQNPAGAEKLIEYAGERSFFAMAESGGNFAYSQGGKGTILTSLSEKIPIERSMGLPVKIMDGDRWFVILDGDGGLAWHDNQTGKLLAVFRLYGESWILEDISFPGGKIIKGPAIKAQQ